MDPETPDTKGGKKGLVLFLGMGVMLCTSSSSGSLWCSNGAVVRCGGRPTVLLDIIALIFISDVCPSPGGVEGHPTSRLLRKDPWMCPSILFHVQRIPIHACRKYGVI